ncbi:hypothetical protein GKC32_03255 [Lactobacillus curvatus]|uniref:hypothetical protein n=1 Tax=Latilactobacillus fragifolii TaxID=2814244 RepID=UPI0012B11327|nr:hypothetical protein [Latilactobacillus fragifolii]MSD83304.1 hypothetical protein [Latilactobacillus curvatus]MSE23495.1 hypothetical protein [Latilactobacillus curvatus]
MLRSRPAFLLVEQIVALSLLLMGGLTLTISLHQFKAHQVQRRCVTAEYAVMAMAVNRLVNKQPPRAQWQLQRETYQVVTQKQAIYVTNKAGERVALQWHCY